MPSISKTCRSQRNINQAVAEQALKRGTRQQGSITETGNSRGRHVLMQAGHLLPLTSVRVNVYVPIGSSENGLTPFRLLISCLGDESALAER